MPRPIAESVNDEVFRQICVKAKVGELSIDNVFRFLDESLKRVDSGISRSTVGNLLKRWTLSRELLAEIEKSLNVPSGSLHLSSYATCAKWEKEFDVRNPDHVTLRETIAFVTAENEGNSRNAIDLYSRPLEFTYRSVGTVNGQSVVRGKTVHAEAVDSQNDRHWNSLNLPFHPYRLTLDLSKFLSQPKITIKNSWEFIGGYRASPDCHMHFHWPVSQLKVTFIFKKSAIRDLRCRYIPTPGHETERGTIVKRTRNKDLILVWHDVDVDVHGTYDLQWKWSETGTQVDS